MSTTRLQYGVATLMLLIGGLVFCFGGNSVRAQEKSNVIPDSYIIVLKDSVGNPADIASDMAKTHGLSVVHVYEHALKGFSATIPEARLNNLKKDSRIQFVSVDRTVQAQAQTTPSGVMRINTPPNANTGAGIGVAVIDTGIDLTHPDLQPNVVAGYSCIRGKKTANDDNGHGSHVAGTIAAVNNTNGVIGVAPGVKLVAIKVLSSSGSGSWSSVICGIDWVTANEIKYNIKVANMSLGGVGTSDNNCGNTNNDALHKAICKSTQAGVTYVVAAGNDSANASGFSPASYNDTVVTVSALADSDGRSGSLGTATSYGADDTFASFSNFGSVVDIAAPGISIYSTWKSGGYNTISGTSMATPHVSGSAALYIKSHPGATWQQVRDGLVAQAEVLGAGHTDPSGIHPEPVVIARNL